MEKTTSHKKIRLPRITRIALENFDLYTHRPDAEVSIEKGVFCLIGANGLGKSTFLNTINFAITGAIPDPLRKFQSASDYFKNASRVDRAEDYFSGRISEGLRPLARATVDLSWGAKVISVTRNIFQGGSVSNLVIRNLENHPTVISSFTENQEEEIIDKKYEDEVTTMCGLDEFAQFVFLFHFVCTFDEGRHLLMWDDGALTNALYLAFGTDPAVAKIADKLQRDMERESSRARNVKFAARHVSDRINQLSDILSGEGNTDHISKQELLAKYEALNEIHNHAETRVRLKQSQLRDADMRWTELSASLTETQIEYRKAFSDRLRTGSTIEHHPIVRATISEDQCAICGNHHIAHLLQEKLDDHECPLCGSVFESSSINDNSLITLQNLDKQIVKIRHNLSEVLVTRERLSNELALADEEEAAALRTLREFEREKSESLSKSVLNSELSTIKREVEKLEAERHQLILQSEQHYRKRDEIRGQLRTYERSLKNKYDIGAQHFVPRFRELAEEFIGLDIDIDLEHRKGANDSGFGLALRMNDQLRSKSESVSESQRFFIDIALRMALTEFMSDSESTLLIDTPEGSLDIAYEARAGSMFSKFVHKDNQIIMTANLRSSQLVLRLAELQRKEGMQIVKMTDWTDLSEVQQSEESLFNNAYEHINSALQ